jgi:hypothetical protein
MIKLVDLLREIMKPSEDFYHGTGWEITLQNLDMERTNVPKAGRTTGSSLSGTGLYVTRDLWSSQDAHYEDNPVTKEGPKGVESAEKYAKGYSKNRVDLTTGHPIYIYKVKLKPDFHSVDQGSKELPNRVNMQNVNKEQRKECLALGIDGIDLGQESLILNKDKIASITLAYKATKYGTDHLRLPIWEKV